MPIALSSADVARLEAAFLTLLSRLGYERLTDWRKASRKAIEQLLHTGVSGGMLPLEVATARARYRVQASYAGRSALGPEAAILVLLERVTPEPWSDAALRARFRLTPREVAVARLLAERRGAREIARALGISVHTARRHTEHVYAKLGLGSRGAVAEALRAAAEREPAALAPSRSPE
jgi:DNA-binding CsgD family transcriptional regulator